MAIEKKPSFDGGYIYQPKSPFKRSTILTVQWSFRYWNVQLWKNLFTKLLNSSPHEDHSRLLQNLRESFQDYMCSNPQLIKKLKHLLVKQRASLCCA
ncbi:Mitotic checkpoint serine/threonine-protein kinase BUB1 [Vitis vinifera]|uniref:Mitotic checkpoint serine/threonine-protein kinase BUB1 n=1 Tax=Vitis vinifera TaxID=29760 RepID=A0A438JK29_VITVI|nr:Mitotic checkpoint serine/threonine-protein kinase BUB1 [Vitis vinifera]